MPAGTKTAPALTGAATARAITMYMVDGSGDKWAQRLVVAIAATAAAINAWINLYQAVTQASIYAVTDELIWQGSEDVTNALFGARGGKENGINLGFVNAATRLRTNLRVVAPVEAVMQANTDVPIVSNLDLTALITNTEALLAPATFVEAQYTSRRERRNNPRVS